MTSKIDYGHKMTNIDNETGIRYGVIHNNRLASHAWDEITSKGTDLDYQGAIEELTQDLTNSLKSILADHDSSFDCRQAAEEIVEQLELTGNFIVIQGCRVRLLFIRFTMATSVQPLRNCCFIWSVSLTLHASRLKSISLSA